MTRGQFAIRQVLDALQLAQPAFKQKFRQIYHTMSSQPRTIRWGILATGAIAQSFAKDLTVDPTTRSVHTIKHAVVAAASSSGASQASQFLDDVDAPSTAKAYGTYKQMVADKDIDIIYIATPHSHHYQNAMLCLEAGKNVLCEKAFTVNAAQAKLLVQKAKEKVSLSPQPP